jgi:hypothetical protein
MDIEVRLPPMTDPHHVPDVFASGLGEIENMGGCYRFTLYARQQGTDGAEDAIIAARIVVPHEALPAILFIAARHIGMAIVQTPKFISGVFH